MASNAKNKAPTIKLTVVVQGGVVQVVGYSASGNVLPQVEVEVVDYDLSESGDSVQAIAVPQSNGGQEPAGAYRVVAEMMPVVVPQLHAQIAQARAAQCQAAGGEAAAATTLPGSGAAKPMVQEIDGLLVDDNGVVLGAVDMPEQLAVEAAEAEAEREAADTAYAEWAQQAAA